MREWIGGRVVKNLSLSSYTIKNRKFEDTAAVSRERIEDDQYGVFTPFIAEMGRAAAVHPDQLVAELLGTGFATACYDGQNFFDSDHPVGDGDQVPVTSVSNVQTGSGTPWFLLDTSRQVKPIIYQERIPARFTALNNESDENVFMQDEYLYGVRARSNAGFGLWQLAFGSKATLDATNYAAARNAMMGFKGDGGRPLGIRPTTLVVPPSLEEAALGVLNAEVLDGGGSNVWKGTAELLVTPWLA
jgi:phage major head subunit gpT-like protein